MIDWVQSDKSQMQSFRTLLNLISQLRVSTDPTPKNCVHRRMCLEGMREITAGSRKRAAVLLPRKVWTRQAATFSMGNNAGFTVRLSQDGSGIVKDAAVLASYYTSELRRHVDALIRPWEADGNHTPHAGACIEYKLGRHLSLPHLCLH